MNAYLCSTNTYANIYSGLQLFYLPTYPHTQRAIEDLLNYVSTPYLDADHSATAISTLYALNVEAVNQRYREKTNILLSIEQLGKMCRLNASLSIYQFIKSFECLHYQLSEGDIPETSELYILVEKLIGAACQDTAHTSELYSMAEWG